MICQDTRENLPTMRQVRQGGRPYLSPENAFPAMRVVVYNILLKVQQIMREVHQEGGVRLSSENNIASTKL